MKIKFLGVGSAFTTTEYYQSNMLVTAKEGKKMLLDCGTDIRFSLGAEGIDGKSFCEHIEAIYISHLHSDHIGGMEWVALNSYLSPLQIKPVLLAEEKLMRELWNNSLKGGLGCISGKCMHLTDYFVCQPIRNGGSFVWRDIHFSLLQLPHIMTGYKNHYSYALRLEGTENRGNSVLITMDTQFCPDLLMPIMEEAAVIFHDCETHAVKSGAHAHYDELCTLPMSIKKKMWLYHYQPDPNRHPRLEGFKGFVAKGQEFDIS